MNICCGVFECGIGLGIPQPKTVCKGAPDLMSVVLAFLRSFGADVEADSGVADGVWLVVVDMEKGSDPPAGSLSPSVSRRQGRGRWRWWCRVVIASLLSRQLKVLLDAPSMSALKVAPSSCSLNPGNEPLRKVKECSKRHCAMSIFRLLQWMEYIHIQYSCVIACNSFSSPCAWTGVHHTRQWPGHVYLDTIIKCAVRNAYQDNLSPAMLRSRLNLAVKGNRRPRSHSLPVAQLPFGYYVPVEMVGTDTLT